MIGDPDFDLQAGRDLLALGDLGVSVDIGGGHASMVEPRL